MSERFFHPDRLDRNELLLSGPEAHHASHVLRLGLGAVITLFDGEGREADAEIVGATKRGITLRPLAVRQMPAPVGSPVTLAVAPPKGDRFRWLVEKATELNVTRLIPLLTQRTVVEPRDSKLDKLRQTIVAACKQSGRSRLMEIRESTRLADVLSENRNDLRILLHPGGASSSAMLAEPHCGITLLIGPEGGFTDEEVETAIAAGAVTVALGTNILRTETAAIAAAAIAMQRTAIRP